MFPLVTITVDVSPTFNPEHTYAEMLRLSRALGVCVKAHIFDADLVVNPRMEIADIEREVRLITSYPSPS